jgi:hypothetical protein
MLSDTHAHDASGEEEDADVEVMWKSEADGIVTGDLACFIFRKHFARKESSRGSFLFPRALPDKYS